MVGYYGVVLAVRESIHLSYISPSVFSFPDDNLSKYQCIFTKLDICIDILEIWSGIANGQILSFLYRVSCLGHVHFSFPDNSLIKICALIL